MTIVEAQGINSKSWLFVLTEKQIDRVVSLHNTEIKNDATQLRCRSTIISEKKRMYKTSDYASRWEQNI